MKPDLAPVLALALLSTAPARAQLREVEIRPDGIRSGDYFGASLDAESGRFVAGASQDGPLGSGSAYVYRHVGGAWVLESEVFPADGDSGDDFGADVAISGDTIAVGARSHAKYVGAVYVYRRTGPGWTLEQKISPIQPEAYHFFGTSVALDGDRLAVGATGEGAGGAVHVYERSASTWTRTGHFQPGWIQPSDAFGSDLALEGDTIAVGATGRDASDGSDHAGAAYVFRESAGQWALEHELPGPDIGSATFGTTIALDGERVAVGAPSISLIGAHVEGSARVFARSGAVWTMEAELYAPGGTADDRFGMGLALDDDRLLVGAHKERLLHLNSGAVYLYRREAGAWRPDLRWTTWQVIPDNMYGRSLAFDGERILGTAAFLVQPELRGAVYSTELGPDADFYCFCETGAPCGNGVGFGGCATASGAGALLLAYGSASVSEDDLELRVFDAQPNMWGVVAIGRATQQLPFGDGQLCIAPGSAASLARFAPRLANAFGVFTVGPGLVATSHASLPPNYHFGPGDTFHFQAVLRTPGQSSCGLLVNTTNAITVTFQP